jgi:hypothetical protein
MLNIPDILIIVIFVTVFTNEGIGIGFIKVWRRILAMRGMRDTIRIFTTDLVKIIDLWREMDTDLLGYDPVLYHIQCRFRCDRG